MLDRTAARMDAILDDGGRAAHASGETDLVQ
jgi:hypothetical protein